MRRREFLGGICLGLPALASGIPQELTTPNYRTTQLAGIGYDAALDRQDPSNVIKVGDTFHAWYSQRKANTPAFASTVYHATSKDGRQWTSQGQALDKGAPGEWDSFGVITPYTAEVNGKYCLFYTGSPSNMQTPVRPKIRHLGLAVADSPYGPWRRVSGNPVLSPGTNKDDWDSTLVDDAHLLVRNGKYWLYYKGGGQNVTADTTKWGLAVAGRPEGPYIKHEGNPVLHSGHTVCVWPHRRGVAALVDNAGPERFTVQWSEDGIHFERAAKLDFVHTGCGPYDAGAHKDVTFGRGISWGIAQESRGGRLYIVRFDVDLTAAK